MAAETVEIARKISDVFGARSLRYARTARHDGDGTILVFSAINSVMAANTTWRSKSSGSSSRTRIRSTCSGRAKTMRACGSTGCNSWAPVLVASPWRWTRKVRASCSASSRASRSRSPFAAGPSTCFSESKEATKRLMDQILSNRRFQDFLREHDPEHSLRAVGEHVEDARRSSDETVDGRAKRPWAA